jgi:hypothetical protein
MNLILETTQTRKTTSFEPLASSVSETFCFCASLGPAPEDLLVEFQIASLDSLASEKHPKEKQRSNQLV